MKTKKMKTVTTANAGAIMGEINKFLRKPTIEVGVGCRKMICNPFGGKCIWHPTRVEVLDAVKAGRVVPKRDMLYAEDTLLAIEREVGASVIPIVVGSKIWNDGSRLIIHTPLYIRYVDDNGKVVKCDEHCSIKTELRHTGVEADIHNKSMNARKLQERLKSHYYDLFPTIVEQNSDDSVFCLDNIFRSISASVSETVNSSGYKGDTVVLFEVEHEIDGVGCTIAGNVNLNENSTGFFAVVEFDNGRDPLVVHSIDKLVGIRRE